MLRGKTLLAEDWCTLASNFLSLVGNLLAQAHCVRLAECQRNVVFSFWATSVQLFLREDIKEVSAFSVDIHSAHKIVSICKKDQDLLGFHQQERLLFYQVLLLEQSCPAISLLG